MEKKGLYLTLAFAFCLALPENPENEDQWMNGLLQREETDSNMDLKLAIDFIKFIN